MTRMRVVPTAILALLFAALQGLPVAGQGASNQKLFMRGDTVVFIGPGIPRSCSQNSYFKRGERIGFRFTAINPATGERDRASQLVVHVTFGGKTIDLPMRDRQSVQMPERQFWIAEWKVPADAPTGSFSYTVMAKDSQGRTGEFKPFDVAPSQLTVVE